MAAPVPATKWRKRPSRSRPPPAGIAYILTVVLLITVSGPASCCVNLACTRVAVLIIAFFNYYIAVAGGRLWRFLEMASLSLGMAAIGFLVGFLLRRCWCRRLTPRFKPESSLLLFPPARPRRIDRWGTLVAFRPEATGRSGEERWPRFAVASGTGPDASSLSHRVLAAGGACEVAGLVHGLLMGQRPCQASGFATNASVPGPKWIKSSREMHRVRAGKTGSR
jgi:hypothetical protein